MQAEVSQASGPGAIAVRPYNGLFVELTIEANCNTVAAEAGDGAGGICGDGAGLADPLCFSRTAETAGNSQRFGCSFVCRPLDGQDFCGTEMSMADDHCKEQRKQPAANAGV
jgi:hypothetical protein